MFKIGDEKELADIIWSYEEAVMLLKSVKEGKNTSHQALALCNEYLREDLKSALELADYL